MAGMSRFRSILLCILSIALSLTGMQAPAAKPITKRGLLDAIKIGGLTTSELVRKVKERGVSFAVTPDVEEEFGRAGAPSEVIQAVRDNYHGALLATRGVYFRKGDQWIPLTPEIVDWKKGNVIEGKLAGAIPGAHSPNSYRSPLKFLVVTPVG